jgi:hypothetical protein
MTIADIYREFTRGSPGFAAAVETNCGFGISRDEITRIANNADTAEHFQKIWENESWWKDTGR